MTKKAGAPASDFDDPAHKQAVEAFNNHSAKKAADIGGAIAVLERRAFSATRDVELPGGDVVQIRARLPKPELVEVAKLRGEIARIASGYQDVNENGDVVYTRPPTDEESTAIEAASNALIGHILYVPEMAPAEIEAWLSENPDSFSDLDAAEILIHYDRMMAEERVRQKKLRDFRPE